MKSKVLFFIILVLALTNLLAGQAGGQRGAQAPPPAGAPPEGQAGQGGGRGGGRGQAPQTPRAAAPFDMTGYWVAIVTEDWRWRMVTPAKGDFASIPTNPAGTQVGQQWDPAKDEAAGEQCKSYGAPAIMRVPGRLNITWQDDTTLKIETDAGQQTRVLSFGPVPPVKPARNWQGMSAAQWQMSLPGLPLMLRPQDREADAPLPPPVRGGTLKV